MTQTERDNIIKQGVQTRRNTYRGKDITDYYKDGKLFEMIKSGKFDDIYVGDYIVSDTTDKWGKKIVWLIADLDNYWYQGYSPLTKHHATIIPSYKLEEDQMNPTNSTTAGASEIDEAKELAGYMGSEMYQKTLNDIYDKYIKPDFCKDNSNCHIIEYQSLVTNSVDVNRTNQYGIANTGASSDWTWATRKLDLMSEINVYGSIVWSSSGYDIGIDNRQYAIFQLRPELINQGVSGIPDTKTGRYWYWLKGVASSQYFAIVADYGNASGLHGISYNSTGGVRPRFLID